MKFKYLAAIVVLLIAFTACNKENDSAEPGATTEYPEIISLTSDKSEIKVGGEDPAIITCEASGGNISYEWEVDLGDIFPLNESGSQVRFTGSECCVGEKIIKCKASNDKGSVAETILINIYIP